MPELLLELFSEEIPARMQARAAEDLARLLADALKPLDPRAMETFHGPRRIALTVTLSATLPATTVIERGPRDSAPEQALTGFLRKHGVDRSALRQEGGYWVLEKTTAAQTAAALVGASLPALLRRFPWPKSMRWGGTSAFTWVRPLRRILCLLDGVVVPFDLTDGDDDGHGLRSGDVTEGHRFLSPGGITVSSVTSWRAALAERHVIVDAEERRRLVRDGVEAAAHNAGLAVVPDDGLLDEVAGLVEYPVALLGTIDDRFMDLPPEVMQVSMRVNQRYFALRRPDGTAAPRFAFVANVVPADGGATIVAGNERVLRARFADARHFWDLDRAAPLASRVAALDGVTFHASLGSQGERVRRLERLAAAMAPLLDADPAQAARAARLAKADLTTGMVGEFPELQGVMGGYYTRHDGEAPAVAEAVAQHYAPRGAGDAVPRTTVAIAVALADKLDTLAAFFAVGEKPTGSGDPYALRRAALGVIRIVRENGLRLDLTRLFALARDVLPPELANAEALDELPGFIAERLRVQLRSEGLRHDVLAACAADGDITRLLAKLEAITALLGTEDGANLLAASKRASNILRIEEKKDGPHDAAPDPALYAQDEERALAEALRAARPAIETSLADERFVDAMTVLAGLRPLLDAFFDKVTVNADDPSLRINRLRLLAALRGTIAQVADFGRIEG